MSLDQTYAGLRVIDLATNFAGPYAAMILGDMGAEVIKVERAPGGDDTRHLPPFADGMSTVFAAVNRGKKSIMLDFKAESDRATLLELVRRADVVIESFPPGVGDKLALDWKHLSAANPSLILASVSAFGAGPLGKTMPGYDALVQAVSGMMSFTGNEGDPSVRLGPSVVDLTTGIWTATGIMAALVRRAANEGGGEHVTTALIDTAFNLMNHQLLGYLTTHEPPRKLGSGAPSAAPYGVYQASDGEVLIATASDEQFVRLCCALKLEDVAEDLRFRTMAGRLEARLAIDAIVAQKVKTYTVVQLLDLLEDHRISAGRVNTVPEACALPVVQERHLFAGGADGRIPQLRLPLSDSLMDSASDPPSLDGDRAEILAELEGRAT